MFRIDVRRIDPANLPERMGGSPLIFRQRHPGKIAIGKHEIRSGEGGFQDAQIPLEKSGKGDVRMDRIIIEGIAGITTSFRPVNQGERTNQQYSDTQRKTASPVAHTNSFAAASDSSV